MSEFQLHTQKLASAAKRPAWLAGAADQAAIAWANAVWPTRKTEHFKYVNLATLNKDLPVLASAAAKVAADDLDFITLDATRLVFVDGIFAPEFSDALIDGLELFSSASADAQTVSSQKLNSIIDADRHLFTLLNTLLLEDGVLLNVAASAHIEKPIYIVNVATGNNLSNPRVLVSLGANASAQVIEHYISLNADAAFVNTSTELFVGDNANLAHYRLNLEEETVRHIGAVHVEMSRNSRLRGFSLTLGSRFNRVDYQVNHRGPGAELDLQGLYLPKNKQVADVHTNISHWVPHCTSNEVFRGIIGDSAQAVFNGRIYIHQDAQKTLAELSNKNMLTSHKAEVNTKPELEIYADDVKCAHGATVSQLNDNARFYLQSRGVSKSEAEVMLSFGFVNELLDNIQHTAVHDYLLPRLAARFGRDQSLMLADAE